MSAREAARSGDALHYPLLEGLTARDRGIVFAGATTRQFAANSLITAQGEAASHFYLLVSGCVRLFYTTADGRKILLIWVAPGEPFGAATLLAKPRSYMLSAEAVKASKALVWDRASIRGFSQKYPRIMDNALSAAGDYLQWYMSAHISLTCNTARERLADVLLGLARGIGEKRPGGIEIDVTNEDLANSANITPYTASRLMSEWQKNRAIVKRRGKVLLRSSERLLPKTV
jgi:CRP/FNR family transcriptional regulator, nitrogen oxide reductase regulator